MVLACDALAALHRVPFQIAVTLHLHFSVYCRRAVDKSQETGCEAGSACRHAGCEGAPWLLAVLLSHDLLGNPLAPPCNEPRRRRAVQALGDRGLGVWGLGT